MATHTFGTTANNSLTAVTFEPGLGSGLLAADIATIANAIRVQNAVQLNIPGAFSAGGQLFLPGNKGVIRLEPGDIVAVDTNSGWPIVVSKYGNGAVGTPWVFT